MTTYPYKDSEFQVTLLHFTKPGQWRDEDLAEAISPTPKHVGITFDRLQNWKSGKSLPTPDYVPPLCDALFGINSSNNVERLALERAISEAWQQRIKSRTKKFVVARVPDDNTLSTIWEFDRRAYGTKGNETNNITYELFKDWRYTYPDALIGAFPNLSNRCSEDDNEAILRADPASLTEDERLGVFAVLGIIPVKPSWAKLFMERRANERKLVPNQMAGRGSRWWYISGISRNPMKRMLQPLFVGLFIEACFELWRGTCGLRRGTVITIVAEGATEEGALLLDSLRLARVSEPQSKDECARYQGGLSIDELAERLWLWKRVYAPLAKKAREQKRQAFRDSEHALVK